ncbi:MAG: glucoamylase family protein [Bacteroidales bacterium]
MKVIPFILSVLILFTSCRKNDNGSVVKTIEVDSVFINSYYVANNSAINSIDFSNIDVRLRFSEKVDTNSFNKEKLFITGGVGTSYAYKFATDLQNLVIKPTEPLQSLYSFRLLFDVGSNLGGQFMESYSVIFRTGIDSTPKFQLISDNELLTLVQQQTFRYFWDYAHPVSGLARERLGSGETVTSGGSGFGLMAILVGIERNFITREEGFGRLSKIVNFLSNSETDRFHGAFPHWLNGSTGKIIPFSQKDNGGDLVETAFLMQGLLTVKEYFKNGTPEEKEMCTLIDSLYQNVEWNWYRKNNENVLYWHWSPEYNWEMNHQIRGWQEALIVYILAAGSPTHPVPAEVYNNGWARNGANPMVNNKTFYGIHLPLGYDYGGPLFFSHYSFLGLDPRNLTDQYADYWQQNIAHTLINRAYCISNPRGFAGYSEKCWGLTASDIQNGYSASSPTNDLGVIAPTAAISSIPYTPDESLDAIRFFYYTLGDKIWGDYGFKDAFNLSTLWFADSYLAIDQGPIICMIENYRTGMLWNLLMQNENVQTGLNTLGFSY